MWVRMNPEIKKARSREGKGCYTLSEDWEISQDVDTIILRYKRDIVLKITSEGEILFSSDAKDVELEKENGVLQLNGELAVVFWGFDIVIKLNSEFAVEFQEFLEDGFAIELS